MEATKKWPEAWGVACGSAATPGQILPAVEVTRMVL